jgi:hypothetical protein
MTKSDLAARPIFHRKQDSIEAHPTVVFAALAIGRYLQHRTGLSIKRLVQTLRPLQAVTITIAGHQVTAQPQAQRRHRRATRQNRRSHRALKL